MKLRDAVLVLQAKLPLLTEQFTDTIAASSVVHSGTTATVTTAVDHGLVAGNLVHIVGALTPIAIASITAAGGVATVTTSADHDLTYLPDNPDFSTVDLDGATEGDFNGTFTLLSVPNRRTFTMAVDGGAPASATGSPRLLNGSNVFRSIRGLYAVATTPTSDTFTIEHTAASDLGTLVGTITVRAKPRITAAVSDEAAIASFTRDFEAAGSRPTKTWLYVVLEDAIVNRGKESRLDAIDTQFVGADWQQFIIQSFRLLVVSSSADQRLARTARDTMQDLLRPILRSILGVRFDSGLASGDEGAVQFVGHGLSRYDHATYWHAFEFEIRDRVTAEDTVGGGEDVAFRDIEIDLYAKLDAGQSATFDPLKVVQSLDDEPL